MKEYTVKVFEDGSKRWYLDGKLHREDGPAFEWADGSKEWLVKGQIHREDGPAIEYADGTKQWWLHNKRVTEEEHKRRAAGKDAVESEGVQARMMLAAPDLLAALENLLETSTGQGAHEQWLEAMDQARAAIAKARERSNEKEPAPTHFRNL